jgi:V/A-type H+-transporting ATPase subunit I
MLRSEEMTRTVIVGSMDGLGKTVECLYELGVLHLIDYTTPDEDFKLGPPLPGASAASQKLLKLRSMIRALELEGYRPDRKLATNEIENKLEQAMVTLDLNTTSKVEAKQKIVSLIREKEGEIRALEPFQEFGIPAEDYDGYESISVFPGICKTNPTEEVEERLKDFELFTRQLKGAFAMALFVRNEEKTEAARILSDVGYQETKIPKLKGQPAAIIAKNREEISELETDLTRIEADIEGIRKRFADFIIASEEDLSITVLKAETPLRFAASENSFVIDGWVPKPMVEKLSDALDCSCSGVTYLEAIGHEKEEPPVKLKNPEPVKPFEFFINLVSTPKYDEIDPTFVLFITFPLFFGFMIGDLGFGISLFALGAFIRWKFKSPDAQKLAAIILVGGFMASLFGLVVYAEAFGVPFHPPPEQPDENSWEVLANLPFHPLLDKMRDSMELIALSIVAGWIHLSVGFGFGFVNHYRHSKKHAVGKIAWLLVLLGVFTEIMVIAGGATETSRFMNATILSPIPDVTRVVIGIDLSLPALGMILVGVVGIAVLEGGMALTEVVGVFTNLVSYARLAAMAIGKGAVAIAFNFMLFPLIFESGNIVIAVLGALALFVCQAFFVFFIGALGAGIQAIRLNYVEFFLKFFEGGGTDFRPMKYERKYSVATK